MTTAKNFSYKSFLALWTTALIAFGCGEVKTADDAAAVVVRIPPNLPVLKRIRPVSHPSNLKCPPKR